ncbi:MAG: hypothetical protein AMXMBFR84_15190 [Candidatus Hydrogenedentota bacterium]
MMPTPNIYRNGGENPFESVRSEFRTNEVDIIYATDRMPDDLSDAPHVQYGHMRSPKLVFGQARIGFGEDVSWENLVEESLSGSPRKDMAPRVIDVREITSLPDPVDYLNPGVHAFSDDSALLNIEQAAALRLHSLVNDYVEGSEHREAYVFVHGYNVNFDDSVKVMAELWHFLGRDGVPIAYTWPAGHGGLRGYTIDRESGEFTVWHLKRFLTALAACPSLDRINIIAHSRGTDVVITALRELHQFHLGGNRDTRSVLKLGNVVLAAPDLDLQVATQRIIPEGLGSVPERLTIYISEKDRAMEASNWLFGGVARLGRLTMALLLPLESRRYESMDTVAVIDARTKRADIYGHSYFYQSPAVSSDLILLLRKNCDPGIENGRPLRLAAPKYWVLDDSYPSFPKGEDGQ